MREYSIGTLIDIGASLRAEQVALLVKSGQIFRLKKGEIIYRQSDPAHDVCFLLSGQAKSVLINSGGGECLLRIHLPHSIMGLTALATSATRDAEAIATTDGELVRIARARFQELMTGNPEFGAHVVELLVNRMSDFHHRVGDFLAQNVEQRLAHTLLSLSRSDPEKEDSCARQPVRLTHEELASLLNARRPTITAILNRFAADGLIVKKGRALHVIDADRLNHLLPRSD